jgi:biotin carboxyl carrier protein
MAHSRLGSWDGMADIGEMALTHGEILHIPDRVVVAPAVGRFRPLPAAEAIEAGATVVRGQTMGFLENTHSWTPVRSPFSGRFIGMLALPGEPVSAGHPIALLRALEHS